MMRLQIIMRTRLAIPLTIPLSTPPTLWIAVQVLSTNCGQCHWKAMHGPASTCRAAGRTAQRRPRGPAITPPATPAHQPPDHGRRTQRREAAMPHEGPRCGPPTSPPARLIQQGAPWLPTQVANTGAKWWSFQKPTRPTVPRLAMPGPGTKSTNYPAKPGLPTRCAPAPEADRRTLIRRDLATACRPRPPK